jgi:histidyl-tRNA synthetase
MQNQPRPQGKSVSNVSIARGLGILTGTIFEIRIDGCKSSLGGGGRYDGLIGIFCGVRIPAVGFSIGFERLVMLLEERNLFGNIIAAPML